MGDMSEDYAAWGSEKKRRKILRRQANIGFLETKKIPWMWVDEGGDHIRIRGRVDYYLGSTYWYDRETGRSGYSMLSRLSIEGCL